MLNIKKKKVDKVFIISVLIVVLCACKTQKQTLSQNDSTVILPIVEIENIKETEILIKNIDYQWITYRCNASIRDYENESEQMAVNVFFVNRKDSIIYLNISKFGIEGARAVFTPDSVKYVNHLESSYYSGDYHIVPQLLGFEADFYMLQALLVGNDWQNFNCDKILQTQSGDTLFYSFNNRKHPQLNLTLSQEIQINALSHRIIANYFTEKKSHVDVEIDYQNFTKFDNIDFFTTSDIAVPQTNTLIKLTIKDLKIDIPGPTNIKIPQKYQKIKEK
ncbi:MAG: DUF4292 domain-containing protein [Bacteroidales bacterium]|jgi:hypothetical protein|nr:DUF4292 domain-containing protein [Bacteroidales bacterium]